MRKIKSDSYASWKAAQEIPDREEDPERYAEEITEWSFCEKHGKYPTDETEIIGEGFRICPLCYMDEKKRGSSNGN